MERENDFMYQPVFMYYMHDMRDRTLCLPPCIFYNIHITYAGVK